MSADSREPVDAITITLPLPERDLSPNSRCHWARKARATKASRALAYAVAFVAMDRARLGRPRWERAEAQAVFFRPDRRRVDADNLAASCKAYFDGIAD